MSNLDTLPIEIIYQILTNLDQETILFQFGYVCKRFYSIIQTYNRYKLNFQSISKIKFHILCQRIRLENIISLTLSNDQQTPEQIKLFLSKFQIEQFTRLQSLTLIQIDEDDFHRIFQSNLSNLQSLTFSFSQEPVLQSKIFSILSSSNLRTFHFDTTLPKIIDFPWPKQSRIQTLHLSTSLSFQQVQMILSCSKQLKKLVLNDCYINESIENATIDIYPQVLSLTLHDTELDRNGCEFILSKLPSLEYFYIMGGDGLADGSFWEKIIKTILLNLKTFEFAFWGDTNIPIENSNDLESAVVSFRTSFWLEEKHWYAVCYYFRQMDNYSIYSLPISKSNINFYSNKEKILYSTRPNWTVNSLMVNKVRDMTINLTKLMNLDNKVIDSLTYPYFRKLNKLNLSVETWTLGSTDYLSVFINLFSIVELSLTFDCRTEHIFDSIDDIKYLFRQTSHLRCLTFYNYNYRIDHTRMICSIVPDHVRSLRLPVWNTDEMRMIIEHLPFLTSVRFDNMDESENLLEEFISWILEKRKGSSYRIHRNQYLNIWLFDQRIK